MTPRSPMKTRKQTAAGKTATATASSGQEHLSGTVEYLENLGNINQTNTDATLVDFESSTGDSHMAGNYSSTVAVSQPTFLELLSMINETRSRLKVERQRHRLLEEMQHLHTRMTQNLLAQLHARDNLAAQLCERNKKLIEYHRVQTLQAELRIRNKGVIERQHITKRPQAELPVCDAKVIKNCHTNEGVQTRQLSIQQQLTQIGHHLNQMSQTLINLQIKTTNITNNKDNTHTLENSLDNSSGSYIQSTVSTDLDTLNNCTSSTHVVRLDNNSGLYTQSTVSTDLRTGYNLKIDRFDGSIPLTDFLDQFDLGTNNFNEEKKLAALSSCLCGDAVSVLRNFEKSESFTFKSLKTKLKEHFGVSQLESIDCSSLHGRIQEFREDLPTADVEKYAEDSSEVRDEDACSQSTQTIYNEEVGEILQEKEITSLVCDEEVTFVCDQGIKVAKDEGSYLFKLNFFSSLQNSNVEVSQIEKGLFCDQRQNGKTSLSEIRVGLSILFEWLRDTEYCGYERGGYVYSWYLSFGQRSWVMLDFRERM